MATQTSYSRYYSGPKPGTDSDQGRGYNREGLNKTGSDIDAGLAVKQHSTIDSGVQLPSASTDKIVGITLNDQGRNPNGLTSGAYADGKMLPTKCEGAVFVQIDQDVKPGDGVYVRFAASANAQTGVVGSFRKDRDGVAQVSTGTPTATNSAVYVVRVKFADESYTFEYQADGSATATEVVTGFKTVMAADSAFTARVVATGTTTLILTGQVAGEAFTVNTEGDGAIAWVATTPPAATARKLAGARWLSSGTSATGCGELYFSASAESP